MAYQVIWTQSAAEDLQAIVQYISSEDEEAARRMAERILQQIEILSEQPQAGRVVPEKEQEHIRETLLAPYRIVYVTDSNKEAVFVNRIWHAARGEPELE